MTSQRMQCPCCQQEGQTWFLKAGRTVLRCKVCRSAWIPEGVPIREDGKSIYESANSVFFAHGNAAYYLDGLEEQNFNSRMNLVRELEPKGLLLDVGANMGQFCSLAGKHFEVAGIEISELAVKIGQERYCKNLFTGSVYDSKLLESFHPEVVTAWDLLEHLDDPSCAISAIHQALPHSGYLLISTPDISSITARLMGRYWHYIDLEQHITLFSRQGLTRMLARHGFEILKSANLSHSYRLGYILNRLGYLYAKDCCRLSRMIPSAVAGVVVKICLGDVTAVVARKVD